MQVENALEIGDLSVHPGSRVNVRWRGVWYEGAVVKIGPQRNLCRIRDVATKTKLLMGVDPHSLRPKVNPARRKAFRATNGARVMYSDGETWREGEIVNTKAIGAALVRWRKSALSEESDNWFAYEDIAPIIHNEAYLADHRDQLEVAKRGLIPNDMINPRPRTVLNPLLQQSPDSRPTSGGDPPGARRLHPQVGMHGSPTYESIASGHNLLSEIDQVPPPPPPPLPQMSGGALEGLANNPQHPGERAYLPMFPNHDFAGLPVGGYRRTVEQSSLPCMWSYSGQTGGIPPHYSSRFFKPFQTSYADRRYLLHQSALDRYRYSNIKQAQSFAAFKPTPPREASPSAHSEPAVYPGYAPSHLPKGKLVPSGKPTRRSPNRERRAHPSNREGSPKRQHHMANRGPTAVEHHHPSSRYPQRKNVGLPTRPPPQPYEVPRRSRTDLKSRYDRLLPPQPGKLRRAPADVARRATNKEPVDYAEVQFTKPKGSAPTVTSSSPPVVMVKRGSPTLLTCVAKSDGAAPLKYEWFKDGTKITSDAADRVTLLAPEMLHVGSASDADTGKYTCTVSNEYGSETRSFYLGLTTGIVSPNKEGRPIGQFTNKVTSEELGFQPPEPESMSTSSSPTKQDYPAEDRHTERDLDTLLDIDPELFSMEKKTYEDKADPKVEADIPTLPQVIATEERKTLKRNRNRVSTVLQNSMDQYLVGYGEDYGAVSSTTDLDKEGLEHFKPIEIARSLDRHGANRSTSKESNGMQNKEESQNSGSKAGDVQPAPVPEHSVKPEANGRSPERTKPVKSTPKAARRFLKFPKRSLTPRLQKKARKGFETSNILHQGEEDIQMTARVKDVQEPGHFTLRTVPGEGLQESRTFGHMYLPWSNPSDGPSDSLADGARSKATGLKGKPTDEAKGAAVDNHRKVEVISTAVNTSVGGSSGYKASLHKSLEGGDKEEEGEGSLLPMEMESIVDQVRKLQESLEEFGPEHFEDTDKGKKKGIISSLFRSKQAT